MYSCQIALKVPTRCYFCNKSFLNLTDVAIIEGVIFCPGCGYEVSDSNIKITDEAFLIDEKEFDRLDAIFRRVNKHAYWRR